MLNFLGRHKNHLEVGTLVEANYNGNGKWLSGKIIKDRGNGTFDIAYDNGKSENSVPVKLIKSLTSPSNSFSVKSRSHDGDQSLIHSRVASVDNDDDNKSVTSVGSNTSKEEPKNKSRIGKFFSFGTSTKHAPEIITPKEQSRTSSLLLTHEDGPNLTSSIVSQSKVAAEIAITQQSALPTLVMESQTLVKKKQHQVRKKKRNTTGMKERLKVYYGSENSALDVSELDLEALPVLQLSNVADSLRMLDASRNFIESLENVGCFVNLVRLDLSHNLLSDLQGVGLAALRGLRHLDVSRNNIVEIGPEILALTQLESLVMHHNLISSLPAAAQMSSLRSLRQLDLSFNRLTQVTTELEGLQRLDDLHLGSQSTFAEMDRDLLGSRARELYEKRLMLSSKTARRGLVGRAVAVQKRVLQREQDRILQEYSSATDSNAEWHMRVNVTAGEEEVVTH